MTGMQVFRYSNKEVRTVEVNGEPWWVLKDVCDVLEIANNSDTASRLDDDEKGVGTIDTLGGNQDAVIISESGLYSVILQSRKPEAKEFKRWITREVLPSIRKTGFFVDGHISDANLQLLIKTASELMETRKALESAESERKLLAARLDEAQEWYTLKRWAKEHNTNWRRVFDETGRGQGWRKLKALSYEMGYEIKRSFDANYGEVNAYHKQVFEALA